MRFPDLRGRPLLVSVAALAAIRFSIVYLDRPIARMLVDVPRWLTDLAEWVTGFGRSDRYLIPLAMAVLVLGLAARYRKDLQGRIAARLWAWTAGFVFLSIALSGLLNDVVKLIAGRPRPRIPALDNEPFTFGYDFQSFPSGHAAVAFGLALAVGLLWPRWRWPLLVFATAVAASRMILKAHYLGDVMGSALVAWLTVLWLSGYLADKGLVFCRGPDGNPVPRVPRNEPPTLSN